MEASLAQTAMWIEAMGARFEPRRRQASGSLDELYLEGDSPFGRLRVLSPALSLSATPPSWARGSRCRLD